MIREALSYRDVLLVPQYSDIMSRKDVSTRTRLSRNIWLNTPIVSSNMDTVTEAEMAIKMAELGGIGIIHRFLPINKQVEMVRRVKRSQNFVIENPYKVELTATVEKMRRRMDELRVNSFIIMDDEDPDKLFGLVSARDLLFQDSDKTARELMTPYHKLVVYLLAEDGFIGDVKLETIKETFRQTKFEKLPVVLPNRTLLGLIAIRDIKRTMQYPLAVKDKRGRLLVGASVGVVGDYKERTQELLMAGADVINIDIAHGHHQLLIDALRYIKKEHSQKDVIVGAVATEKAARDLVEEGADGLRVGVGPGSHCTTRTVAGCGVPQITALRDVNEFLVQHSIDRNAGVVVEERVIPMIADGGIRGSDDIMKALAVGSSSVILGKLLAGCDESPGVVRLKDGKRVKIYRGMASLDAADRRSKEDDSYSFDAINYVPEGVESEVPYQGPVEEVLGQLMGGVHSGMSYLGALTIQDIISRAELVKITAAGWDESLTRRG